MMLLLLRTSRTRRYLWDRHDSVFSLKDGEGIAGFCWRSLYKCLVSPQRDEPNAGYQLLKIKGNDAKWCSGQHASEEKKKQERAKRVW